MARLFECSFDFFATADLDTRWTSHVVTTGRGVITISSGTGRRGTNSLKIAESGSATVHLTMVKKTIAPGSSSGFCGISFITDKAPIAPGSYGLYSVVDAGTEQLTFRINSDMTLSCVRGTSAGTVLGTPTSFALSVGVNYYLEFGWTIHNSAGTFEIRVNGSSKRTGSSLDTQATANAAWNEEWIGLSDAGSVGLGSDSFNVHYDDHYLVDSTGAANNTFKGDARVDWLKPTAEGANTGWTPSAGNRATTIDEVVPSATDYNSTAVLNEKFTNVMENAPVSGATVHWLTVVGLIKKSDSGTCSVAPVLREVATDRVGSDLNPGTADSYLEWPYEQDPETTAAWVTGGVDATEVGLKKTA